MTPPTASPLSISIRIFASFSFLDTVTPPGGNAIMPNTTDPPLPGWRPEVKIIALVLYSITMSLSLVGNILVIYILYKKPETRRLTSFMYVNLAVADLLVTTVVMPESLTVILTDEKWISGLIGELLFKFVIFTFYVSLTASIFSLNAIAFDCFFSITRPMQRFPKLRNKKVFVPFIWISSMCLMSPWLIIPKVEDSNASFEFSQLGELQDAVRGIFLYIVTSIYIFPLTSMSFLYGVVCRKLKSHTLPGASVKQDKARDRANKTKHQVINMSIAIVVAFGLCWLPAHVFHTMIAIDVTVVDRFPEYIMLICYWCGHANSAVNPWMLICFKKRFRAVFRKMMISPLSRKSSYTKSSNASVRTSRQQKSSTQEKEIYLFSSSV